MEISKTLSTKTTKFYTNGKFILTTLSGSSPPLLFSSFDVLSLFFEFLPSIRFC